MRIAVAGVLAVLAVAAGGAAGAESSQATSTTALSADAQAIVTWSIAQRDARGRPFLVVDKRQAIVAAFDADGTLRAVTPALLGAAPGDHSVPGLGDRAPADIRPEERTTPAGRFEAELGRNDKGEDILWVDYEAAVSLHRVRSGNPTDRRLARLASARADDNRVSYGCINVPAAFYDTHVRPLFAARNGVVYVLPESRPLSAVFGAGVGTPGR